MKRMYIFSVIIIIGVALFSCKKDVAGWYDPGFEVYEFSFEYNGDKYSCNQSEWSLIKSDDDSVGGIMEFWSSVH